MPNIVQFHFRLLIFFYVFIVTSCTNKDSLSSSEQNQPSLPIQELQPPQPESFQVFAPTTPPKEDRGNDFKASASNFRSVSVPKRNPVQKETGETKERILKIENSSSTAETPPSAQLPAEENRVDKENTDRSLKFSIKFFSGFNYYLFNQSTTTETENGNFSQQTLSQLGFAIGMNLNPKLDVEFSHRQIQASIPIQSETVLDTTSSTRTLTIFELGYLIKEIIRSSYSALVSFKNSLIPALSTDFNNSEVNVVSHELSSIGVGIKYRNYLRNNSELFLKGQIFKLLDARSQNKISLNMSDRSQFGLSVGLNKSITQSTEIGIELEHSQGQFPYRYHRNGDDFTGLLHSQDTSVLLKIGFHF